MGDPGRLAYIMNRIEDGRTVYNSDRQYVQKRFRQLRRDLFGDPMESPESSPNVGVRY